jgi:imidazolonepropionase-like amidohydrolase
MTVRRLLIALSLAAAPAAVFAAPVPKDQLMKPPANATHFVVVSSAGKHGDEWRWTLPDGSTAYRESILLRGLVFETDAVIRTGKDGMPDRIEVRGVTPSGDAAETFSVAEGLARWKSPVDEGQTIYHSPAYYVTQGGTFLSGDLQIAKLAAAGAKGLALLPSGRGVLEDGPTIEVASPAGKQKVSLHFMTGVGQSPIPVWLDGKGGFFGVIGGLALLPAGYEGNLAALEKAQNEAIAAIAPKIAAKFLTAEAKRPILFRDVKIYDAVGKRFIAGQNVVVSDGKIAMVGEMLPKLAAGARVIDGKGKTLVPGLWDSHMHVSDDFNVLSEVALGVTSIRNPGGPMELEISQAKRRAQGTLVAPEAFSSVIVDGKGPLAAQGSTTVSSAEEAIAAVRKIKAAGLTAVKFYTSMNPAWIKPAADEAHRLGLHVHGHIPAGMRTMDAINAGYDEITHIYFATMEAMPDDVVAKSNGLMRLLGPGKYFKDVDFNAEPMKSLIATMAAKNIAVDPTLVVVEGVLTAQAGKVGAPYVAYVGTLPPATERGFKSGPLPLPEGTSREDVTKSFHHMIDYVVTLYRAGVPIVAGTDGSGLEIVHELELYVQGGLSPAEALTTATIDAARNVHADQRTGSITVGKEADLLLVDGDVEANIGNLRHVDQVVMDGALLDGDTLRKAAGFSGKPK